MGVDCHIYLPMDVDESNLGDAVGIFGGLPKKFVMHERHVSCDVDGVQVKPTQFASMGEIVLSAPPGNRLVDGEMVHHCYFHWGSRFQKKLWIMLSQRSTPFWIAVGKRLVDWFGGFLVYNDCGDESGENLYEGRRSHPTDEDFMVPHDGESWDLYQKEVSGLQAVTTAELKAAWKKAAYREDFEPSGKLKKQKA
jgi:hypothetical protein